MSSDWRPPASGAADEQWPQTPGELQYKLDLVLALFNRIQSGERVDLLEELLDCADWREMFGSAGSGFLQPQQIGELRRFYRAKFADVERFYLAEALSTQLMSAMMVSGDFVFSDALKRIGTEQPAMWQEIREFFGRKELATATALVADLPRGD
jgi:hypothetical protein